MIRPPYCHPVVLLLAALSGVVRPGTRRSSSGLSLALPQRTYGLMRPRYKAQTETPRQSWLAPWHVANVNCNPNPERNTRRFPLSRKPTLCNPRVKAEIVRHPIPVSPLRLMRLEGKTQVSYGALATPAAIADFRNYSLLLRALIQPWLLCERKSEYRERRVR